MALQGKGIRIEDRVLEILNAVQGISNKERTAYLSDLAKDLSDADPEIIYSSIQIRYSGQRGYILMMPPEGGHGPGSQYDLICSHLDSAPSLMDLFGRHRPGANDNGFASALNIAYAESRSKVRSKRGLIIAGFPHEEGPGMYKLTFDMAAFFLGGILAEKSLGPIASQIGLPSILPFFAGYFGTWELFDRISSLKPGLAGSAKPMEAALKEHIALNRIVHSINFDMTGTSDLLTSLIIPYESSHIRPSSFFSPGKMDRGLISDIECMLALTAIETGRTSGLVFNHHLMLGTSDNAELSRYLGSVASVFHVNGWNRLHTSKDTIDSLELANSAWYASFIDFFRMNGETAWKKEEHIKRYQDAGYIFSNPSYVKFYASDDSGYCLVRFAGDKSRNPLNALFRTGMDDGRRVIGSFITYGFQDNPDDLIRHPDSNMKQELEGQSLAEIEYGQPPKLLLFGNEYIVQRRIKNLADISRASFGTLINYVADRSIGIICAGLIAASAFLYSKVNVGIGPSDAMLDMAADLTYGSRSQAGIVPQILSYPIGILKIMPELLVLGLISAGCTKSLMNGIPYLKQELRSLNIKNGDLRMDYVAARDQK